MTVKEDVTPEQAAEEILVDVEIDPSSLNSFPIDLLKITAKLNLMVYYASFRDPDISGMLITDSSRIPKGISPGKRGTIFLKKGEFPPRSRFTLAHEVGHFVLGHHNDGVVTDFYRGRTDGHSDGRETEANRFAAELLMPRIMFTQLWEMSLSLEELSMAFGVSGLAVSIRAQNLNLHNRYAY